MLFALFVGAEPLRGGLAREAGFDNLNLDLMYGLPGQSPTQWLDTLDQALAFAASMPAREALI